MWRELGGFPTGLSEMEDYDLWLRAVMAGWQLYFVEEPTAVYRCTDVSASTDLEKMNEGNRQVRMRLKESGLPLTPEEQAFLDLTLEKDWSGYSIHRASLALAAGRTAEAADLLFDAVAISPGNPRMRMKAELLRRAAPLTARIYRHREQLREQRMSR